MGTCLHCSADLIQPRLGRPQAKYCSRSCKDKVRTAARAALRRVELADRKCVRCDKPIPGNRNARAITCSKSCGVAHQNEIRAAAARLRWEAVKAPCGTCGGAIPAERKAGSKFCSPKCKKAATDARWRLRSADYMRGYLYGLTAERYAALMQEQRGRCAICDSDQPGGRGGWHVDHDHGTGAVRGLLCSRCNVGLGQFGDEPDRLRAAIEYLERHRT